MNGKWLPVVLAAAMAVITFVKEINKTNQK